MSSNPKLYPSLAEVAVAHRGELRSYALNKTGCAVVAEDLVQEAFLKFANLDPAEIRNPRAFLYLIVGNLAVDLRRRESRERLRATDLDAVKSEASCEADAERSLIARERLAILQEVVDHLPPRCRECFVLRRFEDVEPNEIAHRMGISRNMVEKHLRYATVQCALALRRDDS